MWHGAPTGIPNEKDTRVETLELLLGIVAVLIMALSFFARKRPDVRWLQPFNFGARLTPEQRARLRRNQNRTAGAELILLGVIVAMGYLGLKTMFVSEVQAAELVLVGVLSTTCIVLGIVALARSK